MVIEQLYKIIFMTRLELPLSVRVAIVIVYLFTAWNSQGYYQADEHYQIVEFAGLKTGATTAADLPWEYDQKMRPALQPAICYIVLSLCRVAGITDPYSEALVLRLLSGLLAIVIIYYFIRSSLPLIREDRRKYYILLSYFLWFLPFLNVRFSSENWSGLFFLAAVAAIQQNHKKEMAGFIGAGVFAGLSFLFRFQSAFLEAGLFLWLIFVAKEKWGNLLIFGISWLFVLQIGVLIDSWYYGEYVLSAWNYFDQNVIRGVAESFGTSPWYFLPLYVIILPGIPIGLLIALAFLLLLIKKPRNMLVWITLPFLLAHAISPHKEGRFLFPLVNLIPLLLMTAFGELESLPLFTRNRKALVYPGIFLLCYLLLVNATGLVCAGAKAAANGRMVISQYIHEKFANREIRLICGSHCSPYNPWPDLPEHFYEEKSLGEIPVYSLYDVSRYLPPADSLPAGKALTLLVMNRSTLPDPDHLTWAAPGIPRLTLLKESIPEWEQWIDHHCYFFTNSEDALLLFSVK